MAWCTILTPLFNGIEYFKECYDSVITQTDTQWIWIIGINGHGPTNPIYDQLLQLSNEKIIVKNYSTIGKIETLNAMIAEVSSIYIAILDCDDVWIPEKLEFQKKILLHNPKIDVLGTGCKYIGDLDHSPSLPVGHITLETLLRGTNPIINSSVVCRKKDIVWDSKFYGLDDYDLWIRLSLIGKTLYTVAEPTVYHRIHSTSAYNSSGAQDLGGLMDYYRAKVSDVTLVSAYYPIPSKESIKTYMDWIVPFWSKLSCNIVFYTDPALVDFFKNLLHSKATVIGKPFQEFNAFKKYGIDFWQCELLKDHETNHSAELYAIWYEKKEFVLSAIALNPYNTSKFVWCDAGICRSESWVGYTSKFPYAHKIPEDKLLVLRITDFESETDFQRINCVGGGVLGGSHEVWNNFSMHYDAVLKNYIELGKFVGKDQSIIAQCIKENPSGFQLVRADPAMDGFTCWFALLFYLSFS